MSDPLGFTAQGLEIIQIKWHYGDKKEFGLERLAELVAQYKVDRFVVGLPKNINNTSDRVEASQAYGAMIAESLGCQSTTKMNGWQQLLQSGCWLSKHDVGAEANAKLLIS